MSCVAVTLTVDASGLPPHAGAAALSLPATHPNGSAHVGQPVPTYSTVLLALWPHVVTVSVPPSGAVAPSDSEYSSREPWKKARSPEAHVPAVYIPGCPAADVDSAGAVPAGPVRGSRPGSPRQMGSVDVGVRELVWVGVPVALDESVPVPLRLPVELDDGVPVSVALMDAVPVAEPVRETLPVPDCELEGVPVPVPEGVAV